MKRRLDTHIVELLRQFGPLNFDRLCELCVSWQSRNYVKVMLNRLIDEQQIHAQSIECELRFAIGAGAKPAPTEGRAKREVSTGDTEDLQADILQELSKGPASEELLRDRLCVASRIRFVRAIAALHRSRLISGTAIQYRLAGEPRVREFSSLDGLYKARRAGAVLS